MGAVFIGGDELFFRALIRNSEFGSRPNPDYVRYIDRSESKRNPKILGTEDFEKMTASGSWFARKFDMTADNKILDMLDVYTAKSPTKK